MATYAQLKELIRRDIERTDISSNGNATLSDDSISYYVQQAIEHYKTYQFSFNQTYADVAITSGVATASLPTDFAQYLIWRITTAGYEGIIDRVDFSEIERQRIYSSSSSSKPAYFAIFSESIELFPTPTVDLTTRFSYVKTVAAPVNSGDSNAWTNEAKALIACKAKEYIYAFVLKDEGNAAVAVTEGAKELSRLQERNIHHNATGKVAYNSWL